jgi:TonB-dependent receptor
MGEGIMKTSLRTILMSTSTVLAAVGVSPGAAFAAEAKAEASPAASENVDTIVVTARKSIDTPATSLKRNADVIVDSATASDIEKTGDLNLTDSLARIPGVTAIPFYGTSESGYVAIRGFDPRYNSMDVDGNPIWFSSQNHRGAQSGQFPSQIVNEVSVYKTVTPEQDGNSVGGHVSLRTLRAFDGGTQPYLKVGYRLGLPDQRSRIHGGASDQIYGVGKFTFGSDDRFGLVFGFNRRRTADADDFGAVGSIKQVLDPLGVSRDLVSGNIFADSAFDKTVRNTALFAKLETRVPDKLYAFFSASYLDERRDMFLQRSGPSLAGSTTVTTLIAPGEGSFTNAQGQIREFDYGMNRKGKVFGTGLDYRVSDRASLSFRAGYTNYTNDILTRNLGSGFRVLGMNGVYDINGDVPKVYFINSSLYNNTASWSFVNTANTSSSAAYNRNQSLDDNIYNASAVLHYNDQPEARGFGASGGVGVVRLDRNFDQNFDYWALKTGVTLGLASVVPAGSTMANGDAAKGDYNAFWAFMYANGTSRTDTSPTADYTLREDMLAGHGTLYYRTDNLTLLAGARYEHTRDTTDTGQVISSVNQPLHRENSYGNWLPNIQAIYSPVSNVKLRAAFTKTIGRPDFSDFAPGTSTSFNLNGVTVVSGSNGRLGPRISTNYDASLEYYLKDGMISVAFFHKDLANETFSQVRNVFDSTGQLVEIDTIPLNTGSAKVSGIEFTVAKRRFDFLPTPLNRLGIKANLTLLDGQWNVVFTDGTTRSVDGLRSQPRWQANVRLSYDAGPVDFNLSYAAQGRTFSSFGATKNEDIWIRPTNRLDGQVSLTMMHKRVRLTFDALNLTNEYITYYDGVDKSLFSSNGNGRSYWLGVSFQY